MGSENSKQPVIQLDLSNLQNQQVELIVKRKKVEKCLTAHFYEFHNYYPSFQLKHLTPITPLDPKGWDFSISGSVWNGQQFNVKRNGDIIYGGFIINGILKDICSETRTILIPRVLCGYYESKIHTLTFTIDNDNYEVELESEPFRHVDDFNVQNNDEHIIEK